MEDLSSRVAFIEARLTLLERKLVNAPTRSGTSIAANEAPVGPIRLSCNEPGLMIYCVYPVEVDGGGNEFCWIGNDGPIQFILPIRPFRDMTCSLHFKPHPKVEFSEASVVVNDSTQHTRISPSLDDTIEVAFSVPASFADNVNVLLMGVRSVRPAELGENDDQRLLAARFFGARLAFS